MLTGGAAPRRCAAGTCGRRWSRSTIPRAEIAQEEVFAPVCALHRGGGRGRGGGDRRRCSLRPLDRRLHPRPRPGAGARPDAADRPRADQPADGRRRLPRPVRRREGVRASGRASRAGRRASSTRRPAPSWSRPAPRPGRLVVAATGIVIPFEQVEPAVSRWRRAHTTDGADGMPAHVTLIYPFVDDSQLVAREVRELRSGALEVLAVRRLLRDVRPLRRGVRRCSTWSPTRHTRSST